MIKVHQLFNSAHGTKEQLSLILPKNEFTNYTLQSDLKLEAELMRIKEGIIFFVKNVQTTIALICVSCGKQFDVELNFEGSEWLFRQNPPKEFDPADEGFLIDPKYYSINVHEAINQEILLNQPDYPKCSKTCKFKEKPAESAKPLKLLKDLHITQKR